MTILHQVVIPDTPESTDVSTLPCIHCGKCIEAGEAVTMTDASYCKRHEFVPCVGEATED